MTKVSRPTEGGASRKKVLSAEVMDLLAVWSLEDAIARAIATVLKELSPTPVERLAELLALEASGSPVTTLSSNTDMTTAHVEMAAHLEKAVRAALLIIIRSKPTDMMRALSEALHPQQTKPAVALASGGHSQQSPDPGSGQRLLA